MFLVNGGELMILLVEWQQPQFVVFVPFVDVRKYGVQVFVSAPSCDVTEATVRPAVSPQRNDD